jgi:xylan 1,4-beta-xylosidase
MRQVSIDTRTANGTIRSLQGTNSFPLPLFSRTELEQVIPGWYEYGKNNEFVVALSPEDLTGFMRQARIDFARLHDGFGVGDVDAVFTRHPALAERHRLGIFPDMSADPADPKSYNFGPTDSLVRVVVERNLKLVFRIGRSIWGGATPPADFAKYAEIVRRIVLHYNQGWADGFRYGLDHWEIWNEPDIKLFWTGSKEDYFRFYQLCAAAIKSVDPTLKVGGPASAGPLSRVKFTEGFLDFVKTHDVPLDFFSFHHYPHDSNDPYNFARISTRLREMLDSRSLGATEIFLDEWNSDFAGPASQSLSEAGRAAFVASAMIYMQDSPTDRALYYGKVSDVTPTGLQTDKVGEAFIMTGAMNDTRRRLATTGQDDRGFAVLAGADPNGDIQVLVSHYQIPSEYRGPRKNAKAEQDDAAALVTSRHLPRIPTTYAPSSGYELVLQAVEDDARYDISIRSITDRGIHTMRFTQRAAGPVLRIKRRGAAQTVELIGIRKAGT